MDITYHRVPANTQPGHWRGFYTGLLGEKLYEAVFPKLSFLRASYGIGTRLDSNPFIALYLARDTEGKNVGIATVSRLPEEEGGVELINLFVRREHRGRGIGTQLLVRVMDHYPDAAGVYTPTAERLYARMSVDNYPKDLIQPARVYAAVAIGQPVT